MNIKRFYEISDSDNFKEDLKNYLSDVFDLYDTEIEIFTKEEYLQSDEVIRKRYNGHMSNFLETSNFVVKTSIKSNPYEFTGGRSEYSLDGAIKAAKHNFDILSSIKNGLDKLDIDYKFYIKDTYQCYFFISFDK